MQVWLAVAKSFRDAPLAPPRIEWVFAGEAWTLTAANQAAKDYCSKHDPTVPPCLSIDIWFFGMPPEEDGNPPQWFRVP